MTKEIMASKGHLHGWQWRESEKAREKKERAKEKHFGSRGGEQQKYTSLEFLISHDLAGLYWGIVAETKGAEINVFYENGYYLCRLDEGLSPDLTKGLIVGDHVTLKKEDDEIYVDHLLERRTVLSRLRKDSKRWTDIFSFHEHIVAANVDTAVVVVATRNPPLHPKFIDRFLVLTQHNGIEPVICLNKTDLGQVREDILNIYRNLGIKVIKTSAFTQEGIGTLKDVMRGKTAVLLGPSGVGKSSLINQIDPSAGLRVGDVGRLGRGHHTTSSSALRVWERNSYIIDTPGVRSLGMWNIDARELQSYFDEFGKFSTLCKYPDCLHDERQSETICGVRNALSRGLIAEQRYKSYLKILKEL